MKTIDTRKLTTYAMLIACAVVLSESFALKTELIKIHFGFIPVMMSAIIFGWKGSASVAVLADLIGLMVFPQVGAPNMFFVVIAGLEGLTYGLLLYSKDNSLHGKKLFIRGMIASFIVTAILFTTFNSLFLWRLYGTEYIIGAMPLRILKNVVLFCLQTVMVPTLFTIKNRIAKEITFA